jgi:hypothetical protein
MKVIKLTPTRTVNVSQKLIIAILKRDIDAFKATNRQFMRNNQAYFPQFSGLTA